jgi:hypothetical protein
MKGNKLTRPIVEVPPVLTLVMRYSHVHAAPFQSDRGLIEDPAVTLGVFETETSGVVFTDVGAVDPVARHFVFKLVHRTYCQPKRTSKT